MGAITETARNADTAIIAIASVWKEKAMGFSIVVPVYNGEQYLETCISSVMAQSVSDWELILVDDGSTDQSGFLLDRYAAEDSRVRTIHQRNSGQFFARQRGIDAAAGEYVLFLDSDDCLEANCLETLETHIEGRQPDILLYTARVYRDNADSGNTIGVISDGEQPIDRKWLLERLISSCDLNSLWLKAIRRELFQGDTMDYSSMKGVRCGEDKVRLLYPVSRAEQIWYIPDALYQYHHRDGSIMRRFSMDTIPLMMANEMFSLVWQFLSDRNMVGADYQERIAVHYLRNYASVYWEHRKRCTTSRETSQLRQYPWEKVVDSRAFRFCLSRGLRGKEKRKLLAAVMKL